MDSIQCRHCLSSVEAKHFKLHMKYNQKGVDIIFYCSVKSCDRAFHNLKCLRKHYSSHKDRSDTLNNNHAFEEAGNFLEETETNRKNCRIKYKSINHQTESTSSNYHIESNSKNHTYHDTIDINNIIASKVTHSTEVSSSNPLDREAVSIISEFYSDTSLSRVQVQRIVDRFILLLNNEGINKLRSQVISSVNDNEKQNIDKQFELLQSMFNHLDTEYKRLQELESNWYYIKPEKFVLRFVEEKNRAGLLDNVKVTGQFISLGKVLTAFFEAPKVLDETLKYVSYLQSVKTDEILNILQTEFWQRKLSTRDVESDSIVLPLLLYEDDFETGNPLGSRAGIHKLSGLYVSIACLPPKFASKLDNIFLFQLFHADDSKITPKDHLYAKAIKELNTLSTEGITINFHEKKFTIYFKLALIVGDNLGLNTILGYTQSFSANHYCRECKVSKHNAKSMCVEDETLLRTVADYESALAEGSIGIKARCPWNAVQDYHVAENYYADMMHDELEGVGPYEMSSVLRNWIVVCKFFIVDTLNDRLKYFKYPPGSNPPGLISLENIKSCRINMSASEMKCFALNAGLIVGDLIPEGNLEWELYKLLRQILSLTLEPVCSSESCDLLGTLIEEHHKLYIELFGNCLKPKHHFMIHYPHRIMRTVGPLRHLWVMRFEGKHRPFKNSAAVSRNRINLCRSLAVKHQLHLNNVLLNGEIFENIIACGDTIENPTLHEIADSDLPEGFAKYRCMKYVTLNGIKYKAGMILTTKREKIPIFRKIVQIFCKKQINRELSDADFVIFVEIIKTLGVNEHLQAYEVKTTGQFELLQMQLISYSERVNINNSSDGGCYICL